jgi:hypothetical protein
MAARAARKKGDEDKLIDSRERRKRLLRVGLLRREKKRFSS